VTHYYDRDSIHAGRATNVETPPDLKVIHGPVFHRRCSSRLAGYERQEPTPYDFSPGDLFYRRVDSRWAGYERHSPPDYQVIHGDDLDTRLDSRLAGYEPQEPLDQSCRPPLSIADEEQIQTG
jgi:hypothetical protein